MTVSYSNLLGGNPIIGTIPVASGGTGLASSGAAGNVLTSNGTAWVSGAASAVSQVRCINFVGSLIPTIGTVRWYPNRTVTITNVYANIATTNASNIVCNINKNGTSILTSPFIVIASGAYVSSILPLNITLTTADYITADIITATGGTNLTVSLVYS